MITLNDEVILKEENGVNLLIHQKNGCFYTMDGIGIDIYRAINNKMDTKDKILDYIHGLYDTENEDWEDISKDVISFIEDLIMEKILIEIVS